MTSSLPLFSINQHLGALAARSRPSKSTGAEHDHRAEQHLSCRHHSSFWSRMARASKRDQIKGHKQDAYVADVDLALGSVNAAGSATTATGCAAAARVVGLAVLQCPARDRSVNMIMSCPRLRTAFRKFRCVLGSPPHVSRDSDCRTSHGDAKLALSRKQRRRQSCREKRSIKEMHKGKQHKIYPPERTNTYTSTPRDPDCGRPHASKMGSRQSRREKRSIKEMHEWKQHKIKPPERAKTHTKHSPRGRKSCGPRAPCR